MSSASLVEPTLVQPSIGPVISGPWLVPEATSVSADPGTTDTHAIGESIALLAARLHAATYERLVLLAEFDRRSGWRNGFVSCAHWLHWRTGTALGAARDKVRVARSLPALPHISASMRRGQLSYAKVRALTRVATGDNESRLLHFALAGTAAQVERLGRAWRHVDRAVEARETEARHLHRQLTTWVDDDGMVVVRGRLTPEAGAVFQRALEAAADRLFQDGRNTPPATTIAEEVTPAQRRADALGLLAETALSAGLDAGTTGDRFQVVVHVTAGAIDDGGALEVDPGALRVSAETSRRLACDSSVVLMTHDAAGEVLDVGRRTRAVPAAIRRALAARDTQCRFPGCTSRRCDAHHIEPWADGGTTRLDNLVLLCRRHRRAVHEGGFGVVRHAGGNLTFHRPDGTPMPVAAPLPRLDTLDTSIGSADSTVKSPPVWDGSRFDLGWAVDVLYSRPCPGSQPAVD